MIFQPLDSDTQEELFKLQAQIEELTQKNQYNGYYLVYMAFLIYIRDGILIGYLFTA